MEPKPAMEIKRVGDADRPAGPGPLTGIRIIDLTSVVFGPFATQTLGDMGADVIKVEGPEGDVSRSILPARSAGMGANFLMVNRNKKSVVLDLKQEAARSALLKVIESADVFVHNMRPQAIAKLGLGYQAIKSAKPDIIYCSAWGFGSTGPYAERPAYDDVIQAMSGFADLIGRQNGGPPGLAPTLFADKTSAMALLSALVLALFHRERTGEGQEVEVPMFEVIAANLLVEHLNGSVFIPALEVAGSTIGYSRLLTPHRRPYATADGFLAVIPVTDRHWFAFFDAAERPELKTDPRFNSLVARSQNVAELYAIVADVIQARTTADWLSRFAPADVPACAVKRLEDLLEDPHLMEVGFFREYEHPSEGRVRTTNVPIKLAASPGDPLRLPPPRLGQHTRAVLQQAGLDAVTIADLFARKAAVGAD